MLAENLDLLTGSINSIRKSAPSAAGAITLLAASKSQPEARLLEAIRAGVKCFGENRVQEAAAKWTSLRNQHPDIRLHLIGPLQTNKVPEAVALFDVIETLDRPKLADALAAEMRKQGRAPRCYIQINTGEEPQKTGIAPREADAFIEYCGKTLGLPVTGLMCVPPADRDPTPHFALLRTIAQRHGLPELSMGMSHDYASAIRMGATEIRIGTALFGERN
jgi:PLP dependent protein